MTDKTSKPWRRASEETILNYYEDSAAEVKCPCGAILWVQDGSGLKKCNCGREYRVYSLIVVRGVEELEKSDD